MLYYNLVIFVAEGEDIEQRTVSIGLWRPDRLGRVGRCLRAGCPRLPEGGIQRGPCVDRRRIRWPPGRTRMCARNVSQAWTTDSFCPTSLHTPAPEPLKCAEDKNRDKLYACDLLLFSKSPLGEHTVHSNEQSAIEN